MLARIGRMGRVSVICGTYVLLLVIGGGVTYRLAGPEARETGRAIYLHRLTSVDVLRTKTAAPEIAWMGDSTTMHAEGFPSYVPMVERHLRVPILLVHGPGMDFYAFWSLAGSVAALAPKVVVLVANLRNFDPAGGPRGFNDLTAEIDLGDLPRTLALPYFVRGMTAPRLLLARALRTGRGEDLFLTFEGLRRDVAEAPAWDAFGPADLVVSPVERLARYATAVEHLHEHYDRPLDRGSALVRYAAATVARLARDGIAVLVVVTPFAWERTGGHYDAGRAGARIALLRDVVRENGGELVDLHRALPKTSFRDADCHFTPEGAGAMARLIAPDVRRLLAARLVPARAAASARGQASGFAESSP